jgi:hypothetical protein
LTLKSERSALLHFSSVAFACSDALLSRWKQISCRDDFLERDQGRIIHIFCALTRQNLFFLFSLRGKQICGRVFLLRACSLEKKFASEAKSRGGKRGDKLRGE